MSALDKAIRRLSRTTGQVNLLTAIGGPTSELQAPIEQLLEAVTDVNAELADDAPALYTGWSAPTVAVPDDLGDLP